MKFQRGRGLLLIGRLLVASLIVIAVISQWRTLILAGPPDVFLCISSSGYTISTGVQTYEWRIPRLNNWQMYVGHSSTEDGGLFPGSEHSQFVPTVQVPGFRCIKGGWGTTEWGTVQFPMADSRARAFVISHLFVVFAVVLPMLWLQFLRRIPNERHRHSEGSDRLRNLRFESAEEKAN